MLFALVLVAACHRGGTKTSVVQAANIPSGFDVTVYSEKGDLLDYDPTGGTNGAPLTIEDLKSAFRYRQDQHLPMATVLLKRGENSKIKKEHMAALVQVAGQLGVKAYMEERDGTITELQASGKLAEMSKAGEDINGNPQ